MESNQQRTKTLPAFEENKSDTIQEDDEDFKKIKDLKTLSAKLLRIEQFKLDRLNDAKNCAQIKSIDLIQLLRGTQYSTKIEQLFEFDQAIKKLEEGFEKLKCSHPDCEIQAVMAFEGKDEEPTVQYCDYHFNNFNNSTDSPKIFKIELKLHKILFDELEMQLVYIQDRIDYIKSDQNQKNVKFYGKIEEEVQRNLDNINTTLKTTTERIYRE